jgi:PIN domain nuclease of toxin-antitoxin system
MRFFLDTHTYLWFRIEPKRLSTLAGDMLADTTQQALIPLIVPWEIAIKTQTGKLDGAGLLSSFEAREAAAGFVFVYPTVAQTIASGLLPRHHRDPFDRLLIAQSLDLNIPILSKDSALDAYGIQRIWD